MTDKYEKMLREVREKQTELNLELCRVIAAVQPANVLQEDENMMRDWLNEEGEKSREAWLASTAALENFLGEFWGNDGSEEVSGGG